MPFKDYGRDKYVDQSKKKTPRIVLLYPLKQTCFKFCHQLLLFPHNFKMLYRLKDLLGRDNAGDAEHCCE